MCTTMIQTALLLLHLTLLHAAGPRPRFLFLGDSTMRRTAFGFAQLKKCKESAASPGCDFASYFDLEGDEGQRWPPQACEGPAVHGRGHRGA